MVNEPLVSVIVPVHNGMMYLEACIRNLLSQTYGNLEIIVVDDGSTDNTPSIAEEYPIKLVSQNQKGVSAARNLGISYATGTFIHFMDVDDQINTEYYQNMVKALFETQADIACSGMINQKFRHKTILFPERRTYTSTQDKLAQTYVGRWGYVWRYLFRSDFFRAHKLYFEEGRIVEDLLVSVKAVYFAKSLVVVPDAVYTYVFRDDSQINTKDHMKAEKRHEDWLYAKAQMLAFAKQHNFKIPGVNTGKLRYWWRKYFKCKTQ